MRRLIIILLATAGSLQFVAAQNSSLNAFSPYTMYGIGDLAVGGSLSNRAMGGIGIATSDPYTFNYANPASLSMIPRNSALFTLGAEMSNHYSQMESNKTSFSSIDLHDVSFAIPLYKGIGLGFSLTPISKVGYKSLIVNNNVSVIENIGRSIYSYAGEGGISKLDMDFGIHVIGGLSLGATLHYNFGSIERYYTTEIYSLLNKNEYRSLSNLEHINVSKLSYTIGAQYKIRVGNTNMITLGVVVTPRAHTSAKRHEISVTNGEMLTDTVFDKNSKFGLTIPTKVGAGIYYNNIKFGIGMDYIYQDWSEAFDVPPTITLGAQQEFRLGMQYTPDRFDIRSVFSRWTYKLGGRYSQSYLIRNGERLTDWAVTFGLDMPLKARNWSKASLGFEVGQRGSLNKGQVQDTYFNVVLGVTLFGDDMWFVRRKFN